jgi:hypothetical protein
MARKHTTPVPITEGLRLMCRNSVGRTFVLRPSHLSSWQALGDHMKTATPDRTGRGSLPSCLRHTPSNIATRRRDTSDTAMT